MASGSATGEFGGEVVSSATENGIIDMASRTSAMKNSLSERFEKLSNTENEWSIYRVPSRLREHNDDAYTPRIVSIGPFHYGQEKLQEMEFHKAQYMQSLFKRTTDYDGIFTNVVNTILRMEEEARSCYNEVSDSNDGRSLAEILLVDGCFLLELLIRWTLLDTRHDPIFGAGTILSLQRDLALLENQIPFFVLIFLFDHVKKRLNPDLPKNQKLRNSTLSHLCASFFYLELDLNQSSCSDYKHLLDVIRNCYVRGLPSDPFHKIYFPKYYLDWVWKDVPEHIAKEKQKQS